MLALSARTDALAVVLLARLAARISGPPAALVAAALWAMSPYAVGVSLNGLEPNLALVLVEVWCLARERPGLRLWSAAGALAGLALLARVDTVFLVALLDLLELSSRRLRPCCERPAPPPPSDCRGGRTRCADGLAVPQSGAAVQELVTVHRGVGLEVADSLGSAVGRAWAPRSSTSPPCELPWSSTRGACSPPPGCCAWS